MIKPKGKTMYTFSVKVDEELNDRLLSYCGKRDINKCDAVRTALDKHLPILIKRDGDKPT